MKVETPRVRIQELRLEGFRAFENARLSLDDLTVLVGRNGAGKTTLIDAFEFLHEALTDSLENAFERRGGIHSVAHKGSRKKKKLSIAVSLSIQSPSTPHDTGTGGEPPVNRTVAYGFSVGERAGGVGFAVEKECISSENGFQGAFFPVWSSSQKAASRSALDLPASAEQNVMPWLILDALRRSFRAYRLSPAAIRAEPPVGTASILNRDGSNVGDVLKHVEKNKDDLAWVMRHLAAITPGVIGVKSGTAAGRRIVQFSQRSGGRMFTRFEIGDMSDGTLRCLAILLALRQRPAPAIVCIDEIEDSVHPAALAVLLDAVAASTERCQVLLTSHSPEALSHPAVTAGRVRVVEWHDGKSEIFRLSPGAEEMSRPPRSVGRLLRTNSLFTAEQPERVEGDFFEGA